MMAEVVVVGAGVGGLAAAIELAARGERVRVLEAGPRPGGKLNVAVLDGVEVDTGPSVLTLPETLDRLLRLAGSRLHEELELMQPEPAFRYLWPDGTRLDLFPEMERTLASVATALGAQAASDFERFLAYSRTIWEAAAPHFVYGAAPTPAMLLRVGLARLGSLARIDPLRKMNRAIRARIRSEPLRMLFQRFATYNGSDPRRAPATLNCIAWVELGLGGYGVKGGMYGIVGALVRAAERLGVELVCGERVARLVVRGGRVTGAETASGRAWAATGVVVNADAAHLFADLLPPEVGARRYQPEPSMSGWTAILRARRLARPEGRAPHTVLFPGDYMREFAEIFDHERPPAEPTVYLCAQERAHGRSGWAHDEPVFAMANAPSEPLRGRGPRVPFWPVTTPPAVPWRAGTDWHEETAWHALRERVIRRLDAANLRESSDRLVWERTPVGLAEQFPGSRGSIYGAASNSPLAAFRRPANRVRGVAGLYLATGSAHPGGGLPLCLLSGRAAAEAFAVDRGAAHRAVDTAPGLPGK